MRAKGQPPEAALNRARAQFAALLPDDMSTNKTWIRLIVDDAGVQVGETCGLARTLSVPTSLMSTTSRSCRSTVAGGLAGLQ